MWSRGLIPSECAEHSTLALTEIHYLDRKHFSADLALVSPVLVVRGVDSLWSITCRMHDCSQNCIVQHILLCA